MDDTNSLVTTPEYRQVLVAAEKIAREFGHHWVGVEHVQLAILRDEHALPTQVLRVSGLADPADFERALAETMRTEGYLTPSFAARRLPRK